MNLDNLKEKKSFKIRMAAAIAGILIFTVILALVTAGKTVAFDDTVRFFFYDIRNENLTIAAKAITYLGNWESITVLCIILLILKPTRMTYGFPVSIGAILVTVLNKTIKVVVARPRPDEIYRLIQEGGFSFSSGHSITSMFVFGMLIYLVRTNVENRTVANVLTAVFLIPMIFIGLSRIYLGVHYPTDVLAGWCLGITVIMVIAEAVNRIKK